MTNLRGLVKAHIFDLPIGEDVTYSRGYSAGIAAARESMLDLVPEDAVLVTEDGLAAALRHEFGMYSWDQSGTDADEDAAAILRHIGETP